MIRRQREDEPLRIIPADLMYEWAPTDPETAAGMMLAQLLPIEGERLGDTSVSLQLVGKQEDDYIMRIVAWDHSDSVKTVANIRERSVRIDVDDFTDAYDDKAWRVVELLLATFELLPLILSREGAQYLSPQDLFPTGSTSPLRLKIGRDVEAFKKALMSKRRLGKYLTDVGD